MCENFQNGLTMIRVINRIIGLSQAMGTTHQQSHVIDKPTQMTKTVQLILLEDTICSTNNVREKEE